MQYETKINPSCPQAFHPPQAALRRRCPARSTCLGFNILALTKQTAPANAEAVCLAGAEGLEPSARGFGDHCSTN